MSFFFNLQSDTKVYIAWALHASADANSGLTKHTATGVFTIKRNLIMEAMQAAGIRPSTAMMVSSTTKTGMPSPTPTIPAGELGSRVVAFPILA